MKPLVSVIIPTRNSEKTIGTCLKSISEQTWHNLEVLIVDGYSSDKTAEIANKFGARVLKTKVWRSTARNIGAETAIGNMILFLDADMELNSEVVQCCVEKIRDQYDAVIIPEVSVGESFWAKCKALEKACYVGDDLIEAARFVKKSVFERVGGYDSELEAGEDWDLNQRFRKAGYRIGRVRAFIKHDEGRLGLRETVLKKGRYGRTLGRYRAKHPELAKQQLRLIRPVFVRKWRLLCRDPLHASGMFVLKSCEFGVGALTYSSHC